MGDGRELTPVPEPSKRAARSLRLYLVMLPAMVAVPWLLALWGPGWAPMDARRDAALAASITGPIVVGVRMVADEWNGPRRRPTGQRPRTNGGFFSHGLSGRKPGPPPQRP